VNESKRRTLLAVAVFAVAAGLSGVSGCGSSVPARPTLSDAEFTEHAKADTQQNAEVFRDAIGTIMTRAVREVDAADPAAPPVFEFLALSGGGDFGAFGAGFLIGWGQTADAKDRRPDFDVVTGVSTGALLAPFAYVGSDEACAYVEDFYRNPKKNWVEERGFLFFLPSNPSFMKNVGLERDIRSAMGRKFIDRMAEQSRNGKVLVISATDLDLGRQKFWSVGHEAERASETGDVDRLQRILMASAAIPAVFPPVEIDGSLYADGGVTANVFLRLDPRSPEAIIPRWKREHADKKFPKVRYWIIINNQLNQAPKTVQQKWPSILGPSLATAIRSATVAEVRWIAAQADYVNAMMGTDIEVRVVSIPDDWRAPVPGDFQKATMESLADLGRKMGADPNSWKVWATPAVPEAAPTEAGSATPPAGGSQ
jgi:hypothetical protein